MNYSHCLEDQKHLDSAERIVVQRTDDIGVVYSSPENVRMVIEKDCLLIINKSNGYFYTMRRA